MRLLYCLFAVASAGVASAGVASDDVVLLQSRLTKFDHHKMVNPATVSGLAGLTFGGKGSRETNPSGDPQSVKYKFSAGFQRQICSSCKDTHCWGVQGVSKHGEYITRSFYEKDNASKCSNPTAMYYAITVMKRSDASYSNILIENNKTCHAGGHVLRKINGVLWFFVACTSHVSIFSEESIQKRNMSVQGKSFSFFVSRSDVTILNRTGTTFSWISGRDGKVDEFYSGSYSKISSKEALNLQRLQISNAGHDWSLEVLEVFGVKSKVAMKVQGATMIGEYMFLVTSQRIRRCKLEGGNTLNWCERQCKIPGTSTSDNSCGSGHHLVLQDAETDGDGTLYVGTEFDCDGKPFYEIPRMVQEKFSASEDATKDCFRGW